MIKLGYVALTQRPDATSLPKAISANAGIRVGLRMMGWLESDMILGSGMNQKGITAAQFTKSDRGVAWLVGADDEPTVVKSYYLTTETAEKLCARARTLRQAASTLTGYASGELDTDPHDSLVYNLLADVKRVLVTCGRDWAWSDELVASLGELRPHYADWTPEMLAKALTPLGVETKQLYRTGPDGERLNRRGVELAQIDAAIEARKVVPLRVAPEPATRSTAE
jgi:S-DNA-T family DNA segregation ATPase FtsK/SpoIIIE